MIIVHWVAKKLTDKIQLHHTKPKLPKNDPHLKKLDMYAAPCTCMHTYVLAYTRGLANMTYHFRPGVGVTTCVGVTSNPIQMS